MMSEERKASQCERKPVRVWADGCFDITHWGHMNALRQAKALGDVLVVGVHSDAEIAKHKGPTVMKEQERYALIKSCKWVDEVVEDAPYVASLEVLDKYNIDFCVHGEDISTDENGVDVYTAVKEAGRYRTIARTEGVSTTDIVGRMILRTKTHLEMTKPHTPSGSIGASEVTATVEGSEEPQAQAPPKKKTDAERKVSPYTALNRFLPSSRYIAQFTGKQRPLTKSDQVVYIDGAWDLFHIGHVEALKQAKALGTYLIVGIHEDAVVNAIKGENLPIMNVHERVLSVLACRYVDEVIIGAPWQVTQGLLDQLHVNVVARGRVATYPTHVPDPYTLPRALDILHTNESFFTEITSESILQRILDNLAQYERRNAKKEQAEVEYMETRGLDAKSTSEAVALAH